MLAISVPLMSAVFGACLRTALSYHQLFQRLDPFIFRLLVGILLLLTTGQVACITAETWYILTEIIEGREDLQQQRVINACTQVCTTAIAILCQGFYIERLFATTKNVFVRAISVLTWMVSIALFIAWNVKYLLHNGPHLNGDRKYNLGAASLWALALATAFVSICLIYFARRRRLRSPKPMPPLSPASKTFQIFSLSIQTFSLVTLNHLASAIGFTSSLSTSSNATAACVAFFFFNLFPGLSTYSIIYTLCQRKVELVQHQQQKRTGGIKRKKHKLSTKGKGKGKEREWKEGEEEEKGTSTAAEDDPSNWRGDSSVTNSFIAGTGIGMSGLHAGGGGGVTRPGDGSRRTTASLSRGGETEMDLEERGGTQARRIDLFDRFSNEDHVEEPKREEKDEEERPNSFSSWGVVPAPPIPPARALSSERGRDKGDNRDLRTRGASVQLDEIGIGLNWDALEDCQPRESKR
ncbi:hypothetical protein JCM3765_004153 [Sporobolomyces pararoseus]